VHLYWLLYVMLKAPGNGDFWESIICLGCLRRPVVSTGFEGYGRIIGGMLVLADWEIYRRKVRYWVCFVSLVS